MYLYIPKIKEAIGHVCFVLGFIDTFSVGNALKVLFLSKLSIYELCIEVPGIVTVICALLC